LAAAGAAGAAGAAAGRGVDKILHWHTHTRQPDGKISTSNFKSL